MAQALRQSGEQVRDEGEGQQVAGVADGAADRIERLGGYLEQTSGDECCAMSRNSRAGDRGWSRASGCWRGWRRRGS